MKYEIQGGNFPVLICTLDANETMITDSKVNTNSIYQKTSTKYILKRVNNKLHSSRSEIN